MKTLFVNADFNTELNSRLSSVTKREDQKLSLNIKRKYRNLSAEVTFPQHRLNNINFLHKGNYRKPLSKKKY